MVEKGASKSGSCPRPRKKSTLLQAVVARERAVWRRMDRTYSNGCAATVGCGRAESYPMRTRHMRTVKRLAVNGRIQSSFFSSWTWGQETVDDWFHDAPSNKPGVNTKLRERAKKQVHSQPPRVVRRMHRLLPPFFLGPRCECGSGMRTGLSADPPSAR